jgi:hypothetical protein
MSTLVFCQNSRHGKPEVTWYRGISNKSPAVKVRCCSWIYFIVLSRGKMVKCVSNISCPGLQGYVNIRWNLTFLPSLFLSDTKFFTITKQALFHWTSFPSSRAPTPFLCLSECIPHGIFKNLPRQTSHPGKAEDHWLILGPNKILVHPWHLPQATLGCQACLLLPNPL